MSTSKSCPETGPTKTMKRRVVQMTSVHPPFDVRIYHKECRSLALAGYDVTLIAPTNSPELAGYGVTLRAVGHPGGRRERLTWTQAAIYHTAVEENAEIYHFHDPELIPVGMLLKLRGKKVIYDVHEDYPSNMRKQWIPPALRGAASLAVRFSEATFGNACDHIVAATPTIAKNFNSGRTSVVQNFPWLSEFNMEQGEPYLKREPVAAYIGYLSNPRGLLEMTEAIRVASTITSVRLLMAGRMVAGAQSESFTGAPHVELLGELDRPQIAKLLSRARVGIVVYHPTPNYYHGQPTKLIEYMAAGLPVIASNFPFYKKVVEESGCGVLVDPLNPKEIADALLWILRDEKAAEEMGRRGRQAVLNHYNWEAESRHLLSIYDSL